MTNPGDSGEQSQSQSSTPPEGGRHQAPPIEQYQGQPTYEPPSDAGQSAFGDQPASGYPPPSYPPPPSYEPQPGYAPGAPQGGYPPPPPAYPSQPHYGGPPGGYGAPPPPSPYPPPGYSGGDYPTAYGAPQQGNTNTLAIASLVASVVGILCGIGSIVGIVLGIIALSQIKQRGQGGHGLAVAGIVVGAATLIISGIWTIYALR